MQRQKTVATMVALAMSCTATAYALNVAVIRATSATPAAAAPVLADPLAGDQEPSTSFGTYPAGAAGSVVLARTGNDIEFWAAYTVGGWEYEIEMATGAEVIVRFRLANFETVFTSWIEDDRVATSVESLGEVVNDG